MAIKRQNKSDYIGARVSPAVKRAAEAMATSDGQSLASFLEALVRDEAKRRGVPIVQPAPPPD